MPSAHRDDSSSEEASAHSRHEDCSEGSCCGWAHRWKHHHHHGHAGALYGLGAVGAAVFFIQHSTGFWEGVLAFIKALAWPAFLVYKALGLAGF